MTSNNSIVGKCLLMCPEKERKTRERYGLLHKYEIDERTRNMTEPKADPAKTVKEFTRSTVGRDMTDPNLLRPPGVLLSTTRYLLTNIAIKTDSDWAFMYDFIFNRLRSVRQDAVIQRVDASTSTQLLEPMVRFHTYAAQRLCEKSHSEFNVNINKLHLLECLTQLLVLYNEQDYKSLTGSMEIHASLENLTLNDNRLEMEALYILLNIGDKETLTRALTLSPNLKNSSMIQLATKISLAWYLRNYVRVCHLVHLLPPILACAFFMNLQSLRKSVLQIMTSAYHVPSKMVTLAGAVFPGTKLQELLFYKGKDRIAADCSLFGLQFHETPDSFGVLFQKSQSNSLKFEQLVANPEMYYSSDVLHKLLPRILLECTSIRS